MSVSGTEPAGSPRPLLVYALTLAGMLTTSLMVPVVPDVIASDHLPPAAAGWLLAAGTAPGIPAAPLLGLLAARAGAAPALLGDLRGQGLPAALIGQVVPGEPGHIDVGP